MPEPGAYSIFLMRNTPENDGLLNRRQFFSVAAQGLGAIALTVATGCQSVRQERVPRLSDWTDTQHLEITKQMAALRESQEALRRLPKATPQEQHLALEGIRQQLVCVLADLIGIRNNPEFVLRPEHYLIETQLRHTIREIDVLISDLHRLKAPPLQPQRRREHPHPPMPQMPQVLEV